MKTRDIYITDFDMQRLKEVVEQAREVCEKDRDYLAKLLAELERAHIVPQESIPADVITMNSVVRLRDVDTEEEMVFRLVYPGETAFSGDTISVVAPVGTAVLGYRVGDTIEWEVPGGTRRLTVEEVLEQPEAKGDFSS